MYKAYQDEQTGYIVHESDMNPYIRYRSVRAGLSWPTQGKPGYFCILGQQTAKNTFGQYPLVFLCEGEAESPKRLIERIADKASLLLCKTIYVPAGERWKPYRDEFDRHCQEKGIKGLSVWTAPWSEPEYFENGMQRIRQKLEERALTIDKETILASQLGTIPRGDFGEHPDLEFYAVNALRFVVVGFDEYNSGPTMTQAKADEMRKKYGPPIFRAQ